MRESVSLATPPVLVAAGSHVGRMRETNEDRVLADPERGSFAVIDGVGGQAAGEHAAQIALDTIRQRLQLQIGTPAERVREAIALANTEIREQAFIYPDRRGMACVLTLVLLQSGTLTAGHVGDTRLYKMRGGLLRKLTHDHSPIGEREDRGELSEAEAMRHPRRNEVYREVGLEPHGPDAEGFIDVIEEPFESDAALLICSDGLTDSLSGVAIAEIIHRHAGDPNAVVQQLIDQANEASGKDNVSVVYVEGIAFATALRRSGRGLSIVRANGALAADPNATTNASANGPKNAKAAKNANASASANAAANAGAMMTNASAAKNADARTRANAGADNAGRRARGSVGGRLWTFAAGLIAGLAIALGAGYAMRDVLIPATSPGAATPAARVLIVGTSDNAVYKTIGQAMAQARAGDTIQLEPSEYREQVVVTDGVTLIATAAREAVLRAPAQAIQPWTAIIIPGDQQGTRISGVKIAGEPQSPIAIGIHVLGRAAIDDVDVSGTTIAGISLGEGSMRLTGASIHDNAGPGLALNSAGESRIAHNVFARNGAAVQREAGTGVDIVLNGSPRATFTGNVLGGDPLQHVRGLPADQLPAFRDANVVLPPAAAAPSSSSHPRPRAATPRRAASASGTAAAAPAANR